MLHGAESRRARELNVPSCIQSVSWVSDNCNSCSPLACSQATNNLEALFEDEPVRPVLLHGDFWNGNFAGAPNGSKWGMRSMLNVAYEMKARPKCWV